MTLSYRDSGLEHLGDQLPTGTEFRLAEMCEFELSVESDDDVVGEQSFHTHIAPRWQGMRSKGGGTISMPDDLEEGVNLHVQGSNIEFGCYQPPIQRAMRAVGINSRYFDELHELSTVLDAERYVRVHRNESGPVHARDGAIAQLGHLFENDRTGRRKPVQYDSDEHARDRPGYYHTATLVPRRVREAFPSHKLPKEVKHYYAQYAVSLDSNRSIAHLKVGTSYQRSFWNDQLDASPTDLERLNRELEETLLSVLTEAGLLLRPGAGTYVEDAYFSEDSDRDRDILERQSLSRCDFVGKRDRSTIATTPVFTVPASISNKRVSDEYGI